MMTTPVLDRPADERAYATHAHAWWRRTLLTPEVAVIALLVLVYSWSNVNVANFDNPLTLYYLFLDTAPILLIALPMTLVIVTGEIDLSVASVVGLSSVLVGMLHHDAGLSIPVATVLAVLMGMAAGALNGFLVAYVGLPSLAVTIGTLALYRGIAVGLLGTEAVTDFPDKWTDLAKDRISDGSSYPVVLVPFVVLLIGFAWLLHFTSFGRGVFDIGLNSEAAHFSGVNVELTKFWLFVLCGGVSAFAGVYYTLRYGSARGDNATGLELQVIAAVLLGGVSIFGGRGALHGVVAGVLLIGVISSAMRLENYTVNVINIVIGTLLVLSVMTTSLLGRVRALAARARGGGPRPPGVRIRTPQHPLPAHPPHRPAPRKGTKHEAQEPTAVRASGGHSRGRSRPVRLWRRRRLRRLRRRRRVAATSTYTFLPKNLGNAYFDTSDNAGKAAIESFGGKYQEVGPDKASPDAQVPFINTAAQQGVAALIVSANDKEAICDALNEARDAGTKVVTFDSDVNPECRDLFINQATADGIAKVQVDMIAEQIGDAGEVAILSAAANATNQNAWIEVMEQELADNHPNITLVDTVYGDDDDQTSFDKTAALLQSHPDLKGIISPTTVGIAAAARYLSTSDAKGKVMLTGLGTPNQMREYVEDGTVTGVRALEPGRPRHARGVRRQGPGRR